MCAHLIIVWLVQAGHLITVSCTEQKVKSTAKAATIWDPSTPWSSAGFHELFTLCRDKYDCPPCRERPAHAQLAY